MTVKDAKKWESIAKMYSYSYDYCVDKSVELYEKISKV